MKTADARLGPILSDASRRLESAGISNAAWEARVMAAHSMGIALKGLALAAPDWGEPESRRLDRLVKERCRRRPLAYVLGEWDFMGLTFEISEHVLVPRPETEELLELALKSRAAGRFIDVGTGSGCLAVCLAKFSPQARVTAVDVSEPALLTARRNAARHGVEARIDFVKNDLLTAWAGPAADAIVANLPYVAACDLEEFGEEASAEPRLALDGGPDGLDLLRRLIPQASAVLRPAGELFLEVGYDQAVRAAGLLEGAGFKGVAVVKDFAKIDRFVRGEKP